MNPDLNGQQPNDEARVEVAAGSAEQPAAPATDAASDKTLDDLDPAMAEAAQRMLLGLAVHGDLSPAPGPTPTDHAGLEELADDMLQLLRRVSAVEQRLDGLAAGIDRLAYQVHEGTTVTARQVDTLRRDVLGDRRTQAVGSTFEIAVSALDTLAAMQGGLDPEQDRRMLDQLAAVTSALTSLIQRLGFAAFEAVPGEPFDPMRMRCLGFTTGTPGLVLVAVSAGYAAGENVVRPAGVLIADPANPGGPQEESAV